MASKEEDDRSPDGGTVIPSLDVLCTSTNNVKELAENQPLYSSIDPEDWRAECSRVAHRLVDISSSSLCFMYTVGKKDKGREDQSNIPKIKLSRIERAMLESDLLSKQVHHLGRHLESVRVDSIQSLNQVESWNRYIERHYGYTTKEIKKVNSELKKVIIEVEEMDGNIVMKKKQLTALQNEIKNIKQELHDWTQKITDSAPLVELKSTHEQMKEELTAMKVKSGLLWLEFVKTEPVPGGETLLGLV